MVVYDTIGNHRTEQLLRGFVIIRHVLTRAVTLAAVLLTMAACATRQDIQVTPPPLIHSTSVEQVDDVDVLAVSPAMEAFLDRYVRPYPNQQTRLNLLALAVASTGVLGFDYDDTRTLSAEDAFSTRSGNCIGFANMMVALARASGLDASYQEILRRPEWTSRADTVLLVKHVNVVLTGPRKRYVIDLSGEKIRADADRRIISDEEARALYFNNLGAEALLDNELPLAHAYLVKAIDSAPDMADPWINLGVVYGRNEQMEAAKLSFQTALQINSRAYAAMANLYEVYMEMEDFNAAQILAPKVERYRKNNPYYLMQLSIEALEESRFEESISLLERAIKMKDDDHLLYFKLAKSLYLSGRISAAETSMDQARELAPLDRLSHYALPLHELVEEK
jgi:tetratricopeptide (TPR) repeat protein